MTGGEILIDGNVGNELGHTMRRGLIAVGGNAGDAAGVGMIAGSIFVFGNPGIRNGAGMKRGTIAFLSSTAPPEMLPTFRFASTYQPLFMRIWLNHLRGIGFSPADDVVPSSYRRYCGDLLELGKGEILVNSL